MRKTGDIYGELGVSTWINAGGYLSRLGGGLVSEAVRDAMSEAAGQFVDIAELQAAASKVIAPHCGAEAAIVTSGASAALTLAAAAVLARNESAAMDRLPETFGRPSSILVHRSHRSSYDHALRVAGARLVDFGFNDASLEAGFRTIEAQEIEAAIDEQTVALFAAPAPGRPSDLEVIAAVSRNRNLPLIIDAAPWLPPVSNLKMYVELGASLVAFSGGKALGAPAGTGILCGDFNLVSSAFVQQTDMTVIPELWSPPTSLVDKNWLNGVPRQGIGRGMKVSREEIVGMIVAFQEFVNGAAQERLGQQEILLSEIHSRMQSDPGFNLNFLTAEATGRRPLLEFSINKRICDAGAGQFATSLRNYSPPIQLSERRINQEVLTIDPAGLRTEDVDTLCTALSETLRALGKKRVAV